MRSGRLPDAAGMRFLSRELLDFVGGHEECGRGDWLAGWLGIKAAMRMSRMRVCENPCTDLQVVQ